LGGEGDGESKVSTEGIFIRTRKRETKILGKKNYRRPLVMKGGKTPPEKKSSGRPNFSTRAQQSRKKEAQRAQTSYAATGPRCWTVAASRKAEGLPAGPNKKCPDALLLDDCAQGEVALGKL